MTWPDDGPGDLVPVAEAAARRALVRLLEALVVDLDLDRRLGRALPPEPAEGLRSEAAARLLGDSLESVLGSGLLAVEDRPDLLRALVTSPRLLLGLQDLCFNRGGPYWDEVAERPRPSDGPAGETR